MKCSSTLNCLHKNSVTFPLFCEKEFYFIQIENKTKLKKIMYEIQKTMDVSSKN